MLSYLNSINKFVFLCNLYKPYVATKFFKKIPINVLPNKVSLFKLTTNNLLPVNIPNIPTPYFTNFFFKKYGVIIFCQKFLLKQLTSITLLLYNLFFSKFNFFFFFSKRFSFSSFYLNNTNSFSKMNFISNFFFSTKSLFKLKSFTKKLRKFKFKAFIFLDFSIKKNFIKVIKKLRIISVGLVSVYNNYYRYTYSIFTPVFNINSIYFYICFFFRYVLSLKNLKKKVQKTNYLYSSITTISLPLYY